MPDLFKWDTGNNPSAVVEEGGALEGLAVSVTSGKTLTLVASADVFLTVNGTGVAVLESRLVSAGAGLTGGGSLEANRIIEVGDGDGIVVSENSIAVGQGDGITVNADDVALTTPGTLTAASVNSAAGNHTHEITTSSDPGAAESILATDSDGHLGLVMLITPSITTDTGNLVLAPAGDLVLNPTGNDILPENNYDLNIGAINLKYLTLHAAELWVETLVAQDTLATIGGRILVGPTTKLTSDLGSGDTTIYVEHNNLTNGDRVYLEANGKVEFIAIASAPSGAGPYSYTVTRNLDGTGANDWYAGDAVFNTGNTGDGFIDIYSVAGIAGGAGPAIVGNIRNSTAYNDWTEAWAIGNLNGLYGYSTDIYGVGLGKYSESDYLTIDPTNGIRFLDAADSVRGQLTSSVWTLGNTSAEHVRISATSLQFKDGSTVYTDLTGGALRVGEVGSGKNNVYITSGNLYIRNNTTQRIGLTAAGILTIKDSGGNAVFTFDASAGAEFTKPLTIGSSGGIYQGTGSFASPTTGLKIWNDSGIGRIASFNGGDEQVYFDTDGKLYAGAGATVMDINGISINTPLNAYTNPGSFKFINGLNTLAAIEAYYSSIGTNMRIATKDQGVLSTMEIRADATYPEDAQIFITVSDGTKWSKIEMRTDGITGDTDIILDTDKVYVDNGSLDVEGDIYTQSNFATLGNYQKFISSTRYTGSIFVPLTTPLTSTSFDGDSFSTTSKTKIDLSSVFSVPAGVKAIDVKVAVQDSGSAGTLCYLVLGPTNTSGFGKAFTCSEINDRYQWNSAVVSCDANGDIYYQAVASGANTLKIWIEIWGYYI